MYIISVQTNNLEPIKVWMGRNSFSLSGWATNLTVTGNQIVAYSIETLFAILSVL